MLNLDCRATEWELNRSAECRRPVESMSVAALTLVVLIFASPARAQQTSGTRAFSLGGQIGLAAEAYTCQGIAERKAPTSSQIYANTQFNLFGLRSGLNVLYSTDDSRLRQSMNRLAFSGEWRWVQLSAGDVSPTMTKYSLSGVTIRGGLLELTPGRFMLTVTGGRSQRAVSPTSLSSYGRPAYARWLYAARIGYGHKSATHFHLIGVLAREQVGSLDDPGSLDPSENLSVTPDFGLSLFRDRFRLQGHATAVVFSQDTQTALVDIPGIPLSSSSLFRVRRGSRISFAGEVETELRLEDFTLRAGYERIEPGFQTLGVGYVISDQHIITAAPTVSFLARRLTVGGTFSWSRNNLLRQRLTTLTRMQWGATVQARISPMLSISAGYQHMDNMNRPVADSLATLFQDQLAQTVMLTPTLMIRAGSLTHGITLSGTYQRFSVSLLPVFSAPRVSPDFENVNTALTYSLTAAAGWSMSVTGTYLRSNTGVTDLDAAGVNLGSGLSLFKRRVQVNASAGWSQNWIKTPGVASTGSTQWMLNLNTSVQVTQRDAIRLAARGLNSDLTGASGNFKELQVTLRYDHTF